MAIDSQTKRRSMLGMGLMFLVIAPVPDGTLSSVDRLHIMGWPGTIAPAAPGVATTAIHIFSTSTISANHASDSGDNALLAGDIEVQGTGWFGGASNYAKMDSNGISLVGTAKVITDMPFANAKFPIIDKASGNGIKVDTTAPTFGFADLLGDQFSRNTGGTKPTLAAYNGDVDAWQFSNGDEAYLSYHIPHDYVPGTDIHLHIHWSQNNTGATGGTVDFKYFALYAKGHNQASGSVFAGFSGNPITATFSSIDINDGGSGLNQYQQHLTEVTISAASATSALFDRDDFEPDGVIELTFEMDANNLTGTPSNPFIHFVDIHYQTNSITGTKNRTPDFYA